MKDSEETSTSDDRADRTGDTIPFERIAGMAGRAGQALQRSLPDDEKARAELQETAAALASLQAQVVEWVELHHLVHGVLVAFGPFHARLVSLEEKNFDEAKRQALLQDWLPCQDRIDTLADFAEGIEHIGRPFRREGRKLTGERWMVSIATLQLSLEDTLKEKRLSPGSLLESAEEFHSACHRHLALVDRELKAAADRLQRLSASLLGGLI